MTLRGLVVVVALGACGGGGRSPGDGGTTDPRKVVATLPVTPNRNVDLLFVIDDSSSMQDKQANLVNNFPNFINVLAALPGGFPNVHIGVVTTDMGTKALGVPTPGPPIGALGQGGCANTGKGGALQANGAPVNGTFISDVAQSDGTRLKNFTGNLDQVFSQMARVGATGCGFEQPLHAMRAALDNNPQNAGFLRADALLAVVILTDEDDCTAKDPALFEIDPTTLGPLQSFRCTRFGVACASGGQTPDEMNTPGVKTGCTAATTQFMDPVAAFHDFLVGLKADPRKVVVAGIMPPASPFEVELRMLPGGGAATPALAHSCSYLSANGTEVGDPPTRLQAFLDAFPDQSALTTICQPDLSGGLADVGTLITRALGSPCVTVPLADTDPNMGGDQFDCVVEEAVGAGAPTVVPPCGTPEIPTCWKFEVDAATCAPADHLKLVVLHSTPPDPATVATLRCVLP